MLCGGVRPWPGSIKEESLPAPFTTGIPDFKSRPHSHISAENHTGRYRHISCVRIILNGQISMCSNVENCTRILSELYNRSIQID